MMSNIDLAPVRKGDVLAGRYRVERVIGVGGMGVVVAATHVHLDQTVAIKFLLPVALANPEVVARFAREARAAVKIRNEHVARVMDVGTLENGAPYMVMEYLEGCDLSSLLRSSGRLAVHDAVDYLLQSLEAIAEAHRAGIVHRDLKPANLFLARSGAAETVKVLDFGISKNTSLNASAAAQGMTQTSSLLGSPLYMSPEQLTSARDVDARSDIWSLGVILYELLAGEPPFQAEALPQLCIAIVQQEPRPLASIRPDVPRELEEVVARCLRKDKAARYGSVEELAFALSEFAPPRSRVSIERLGKEAAAAGRTFDLRASRDFGGTSKPAIAQSSEGWGATAAQAPGPRSANRAARAAIAGVALSGLAFGGWFFSMKNREPGHALEAGSAAVSVPSAAVPDLTKPAAATVVAAPPELPAAPAKAEASASPPPPPEPPSAAASAVIAAPVRPAVSRPATGAGKGAGTHHAVSPSAPSRPKDKWEDER